MIKNINSIFCIGFITILAFTINFYFGAIGVFPIDSFAFFDSSYSILKGNIPFRDYWTISGPLIDLIQSGIFYVLGVSWQTYQIHASLINVIFALSTFLFLKDLGINNNSSLFYSSCVSILAYSSVGVPFPDHHSSIFSIIALYNLAYAIKYNKKKNWILLPICLFVAFFCKQTPAAYFIIFILFFLFFYSVIYKKYNWIPIFFITCISLAIILFLFINLNNINFTDVFVQYFLFPQTIGSERLTNLNINFKNLVLDYKFLYIALLPTLYFFKKNFLLSIIILFSTVILIFHQLLTKNQIFIFFLIPILCGYVHSLLIYENKKSIKQFVLYFTIALAFFSTTKYHLKFNVDRKFMELENIDKSNYFDANMINKNLKGLKWITPSFRKNSEDEIELINLTINHLSQDGRKKIIITYYQFISTVLEESIYSHNRWYTTDGVSYPLQTNKFFSYYKKFYVDRIINNNVEVIYFTSPITEKSFSSLLKENCFKIKNVNEILYEVDIKKCF